MLNELPLALELLALNPLSAELKNQEPTLPVRSHLDSMSLPVLQPLIFQLPE